MPKPKKKAARPTVSALPVHRGPFGRPEAERLLWRAGMGPRPGEADALAALGLERAVQALTRPPAEKLTGPAPTDGKGQPIAPNDLWGHDHLWWLDRMVRSNRPHVERMTLVWHDWFATSRDATSARWMLHQNQLLRRHALGSFRGLLHGITKDPAMLLWLSGSQNNRWSPNENYARELMELFTLGAGKGYTERDVREMARALTGFRNDWDDAVGAVRFRFDPTFHDRGVKRIFAKRGRFGWRDACDLCLKHPRHPAFFVRKLWGAFIPTAPSRADQQALERLYRRDLQIRPVVEAILRHPALHTGPRMVKPPVVHVAGMLRARGRGVDTEAWSWLCETTGQRLFLPPNVAGWDESRWLDTGTFRGRWMAADRAIGPAVIKDGEYAQEAPGEAVAKALAFWGDPQTSPETRARLEAFVARANARMDAKWKRQQHPRMVQNALRVLVVTSPDFLTS
ncbi:DUF1800 family protein [Conexibacter sp. SYSU D00693]|uniref:DUF1800 domain-containing protein n=1 Tax=Conexibacter sp. SYSU D00693 TaxID=2812560 RepID=UPI00196AB4F7|nr:DUF1800 domain-containing protein [Conexibacter sp. SYSU D00693]